MTSPICKLAEYTRKISKGNFELEDIQVASRDEVGELAVAFNRMKDDIRRLIEELNQKIPGGSQAPSAGTEKYPHG